MPVRCSWRCGWPEAPAMMSSWLRRLSARMKTCRMSIAELSMLSKSVQSRITTLAASGDVMRLGSVTSSSLLTEPKKRAPVSFQHSTVSGMSKGSG